MVRPQLTIARNLDPIVLMYFITGHFSRTLPFDAFGQETRRFARDRTKCIWSTPSQTSLCKNKSRHYELSCFATLDTRLNQVWKSLFRFKSQYILWFKSSPSSHRNLKVVLKRGNLTDAPQLSRQASVQRKIDSHVLWTFLTRLLRARFDIA